MQRANSVLLRSVFSAAIVCAVLRAAIFSGADRGGSIPIGKVWETGRIHVRSILTIKTPACSATRNPISEFATVAAEGHGEAALHSCANVAPPILDRSKLARKPPGIVALAFLNPASPNARLDALSTNLIGLGKRRGGIVDAKLQSDGKSDQAEGKIQNAVGGVDDAVRDALKK